MQGATKQASPETLPQRVNLALCQLQNKPDEDNAHLFRTTYRRFQVWSNKAGDVHSKEQEKAVAYLDKVLKGAGKLRDAGLHRKMLKKDVKLPGHQKPKAKFESILSKRYEKRRGRLSDLLEGAVLSEVG